MRGVSFPEPARFCPYCATALEPRDDHGIPRPTCPKCGYIAYQNPSPAVGVVLPHEGGILLVRRKYEPRAGMWSLPAGFMEYGEGPEETARREVREETGFEIDLDLLLGAYPGADDPRVRVVLMVYLGRIIGGIGQPGDDASELGTYTLEALPEDLAFRSHLRAIEAYRAHLRR
jgi:8-oxo-dGTP diphosphatase